MDKQLYDAGLKARRQMLGDAYVDSATKNVDDFNKPFQDLVTECAWGLAWTDETLPRRERSILNLGILAAAGKMHEFDIHFRAAKNNGLTKEELRAVLMQIAVYCGMPTGADCFRSANKIFAESA